MIIFLPDFNFGIISSFQHSITLSIVSIKFSVRGSLSLDKDLYFEEVTELLTIDDGERMITLCHYPMVSFEGRFHIHGHIHGNTNDVFWNTLKSMDKVLNAGVEVNGFRPVTFNELLINNRKFKEEH